MDEIGAQLFTAVFEANSKTQRLWARIADRLNDLDVEIVTSVEGATVIPWELICDPVTNTPMALHAAVFVRAHPESARWPQLPETESGPIRILLVICRPRAGDDVPFRSVASRLIKGLSEETRATYQLDVLRPPTFEQLGRMLRRAKAEGKPYHVVHFDGHGTYAEVTSLGKLARLLQHLSSVIFSTPRTGKHGFLLFEDPEVTDNAAYVDGPSLGNLLVEAHVPVLVLNACRSAHAEAPTEPEQAQPDTAANLHSQVRAFGSLAQEVMDAGVAGVVAMRYNVYVVTAAQFVAELYATLVRGQTLGAAVTMGRKQLHDKPNRTIAFDPIPLQDWCVPVVYEAAPIRLFPARKQADTLTITIQAGDTAASRGTLDKDLPRPPDAGFFGRDETLLALDRAFDTQHVVLLRAYAGAGKTATVAEFARWYSLTGGIEGPVLFTSFEQYRPLLRVLGRIGEVFGEMLERVGVHWLTLDDANRRKMAIQVLAQVPVLWIWDNVEPIAGFPSGTPSAWSDAEQRELADFLRDAREKTRAKFLLTSRRDEQDWLGDLPRRIAVPPMPMQERVQLARALAEKRGQRIITVDDWRPLLRFTEGNPLTITVLVGQALRDGLRTKSQIDDFVAKLGEAKFDDEASEGRTKSLGASLSYGFDHAFSAEESKQLALLHFFQGFVHVDVLRTMGQPEADWCLPEVRGLTREAGIALLDRADEVGLLSKVGDGNYTIHPAVPWFFKSLFDTYYAGPTTGTPADGAGADPQAGRPMRAFVEAMGKLGEILAARYRDGTHNVITTLAKEETNLLHARHLARQNGWWRSVLGTMQGLDDLYDHMGRRSEWKKLVEEVVPDFVNPATDEPRRGHEDGWAVVNQYRLRLAEDNRHWAEAERLGEALLKRTRQRAGGIVNRDMRSLTEGDRNEIANLAVTLHQLGRIQYELNEPGCSASFEEAFDLNEQIGRRGGAANNASALGSAYKNVPAIRDLDKAEHWYGQSLEHYDEHDCLNRGRCQLYLGNVALDRFDEAQTAEEPHAKLPEHINSAVTAYQKALEQIPSNAVNDLAIVHNQLGVSYRKAGDIKRARTHYQEAIRNYESVGNTFAAAQTRYNAALALYQSDRFVDAREYALAARNGYASYGPAAAKDVHDAQELINQIEEEISRKKG